MTVGELPAHLSDRARAWVEAVVSEFTIGPVGWPTLLIAAEAMDRADQARAAIAEHGLTQKSARDTDVQRPEEFVLKEAIATYFNACKLLGVDR